jgi:chromobox protein 1
MRVATVTDLVLDEMETVPESGTDSEGEELYNIEVIIGHKMIKGVRYYRIKWEGYLTSANTWEPVDALEKCQDLVEEYHRKDECRRKAKRRRRPRR